MIKKFDEYKKPKFQKGDRCVFVYPIGKYKIFWNDERNEWSYPIEGKANPTEENFLILYNGQKVGDVVEQK